MLNDVVIRPIKESDAPSIHAVALEAWRHTYRTIFDQQFIENFVNRNYAPEAILSLFPRIQSGAMFSMWPNTSQRSSDSATLALITKRRAL